MSDRKNREEKQAKLMGLPDKKTGPDNVSDDERLTCWTLNDFGSLPVQRVSKYVWLLGQMMRATKEQHPDHKHLTKALDAVQVCERASCCAEC